MKVHRTVFLTIGILTIVLTISNSLYNRSLARPAPKIHLNQLEKLGGIIPVEIIKPEIEFPDDLTVSNPRFTIRNNTGVNLKGVCLAYSIKVRNGGVESMDTYFQTVTTFVHADIAKERGAKSLIMPGQEILISDGSRNSYESGTEIIAIEATIDYVEFENGTSVGQNRKGQNLIEQIRQGAERYRLLLAESYRDRGSVTDLRTTVDLDDPPAGPPFDTPQRKFGAKLYRDHIRRLYGSNRLTDIENQLKRDAAIKDK